MVALDSRSTEYLSPLHGMIGGMQVDSSGVASVSTAPDLSQMTEINRDIKRPNIKPQRIGKHGAPIT